MSSKDCDQLEEILIQELELTIWTQRQTVLFTEFSEASSPCIASCLSYDLIERFMLSWKAAQRGKVHVLYAPGPEFNTWYHWSCSPLITVGEQNPFII